MISYFQFLLLSLHEREQYLIEKATVLLSYTDHVKELHLYAVNDFFVEMHLDRQKQVTQIISFKGLNRLEQHAQYITLSELQVLRSMAGQVKE